MDNQKSPAVEIDSSIVVEEDLFLKEGQSLIEGRSFSNLDWTNEYEQNLTFSNCKISNSDFSGSNLDGLQLENCHISNCDFSEANLQNASFNLFGFNSPPLAA